jgi:hypothetical protein
MRYAFTTGARVDMKKSTRTAVGAAVGVGVAAAAVAAGVVVARRGKALAVYVVRQGEDGWALSSDGVASALSVHATKREAVSAARELARQQLPSQLVIHRADGTIQARHSYTDD